MHYSRLVWSHSSPNEPIEILSEYDEAGWELRKVEVFQNGATRYASTSEAVAGCQLSLIPRPPDEEVVSEPEFRLFQLTPEQFEKAWELSRRGYPAMPTGISA
jgi:hypothetical protein